ncbi:MAG TPA: hypothetical protein VFU47_12910 [Armatimonadota bacterium]|nr:hypothetical protein [Armatimonadota bacterium]
MSAHFWAVRPGASAPPYGKAAALAETVRAAALAFASPVDVVPTPGNYGPARVHAASLLQDEPLRIPEPDSAYAHYTMDLQMEWVAL